MTDREPIADASLESLTIGSLPILNGILGRLQLESILQRSLPAKPRGRKRELEPAHCLMVLLKNVLLARQPLYAIPQWLTGFVPEHLGVGVDERELFNDDRIGRSLDKLFEVDQTALVTEVSLAAVRVFGLQLKQLHNDSTSVTFHGRYADQESSLAGKQPPTITHGFNKDHRPDLKQLVFELTATDDGMVPIFFKVHDGNTTDDATHRDNWMTLKTLVGSAHFLYVADCKLASSESMTFIEGQKGRFLSVLPRTRAETAWFRDYLDDHVVDWENVRTDKSRRPQEEDNVYEGFESPQRSREGFRVLWYRSSQKLKDDQDRRSGRLAIARMRIDALESKLFRRRQRDEGHALKQARKILEELDVDSFVSVRVETQQVEEFEQRGRGRPGPNTPFRRVLVPLLRLHLDMDDQALRDAARFDGLFPLVTNHPTLGLRTALDIYKRQPFLEQRHEQLKSVLDVAPVFLKSPRRIAALMMIYYLALLVSALLERETRRRMKDKGIASLPLYPEARHCKAPTAEVILSAFDNLRRHRLLDGTGRLLREFFDPLPAAAIELLDLLDVPNAPYGIND